MAENAQTLDNRLQPWVAAVDEGQSAALLEQLLHEQIEPLIREIVGYQFRVFFDALGRPTQQGESEDVCSEVRLHLLARLRELRADPTTQAIKNLRGYVAVTAYRACYEYLRRQYPRRYSLKHKLRFLLSQHAAFALWQSASGQWLAGLAGWPQTEAGAARGRERLERILRDPRSFTTTKQLPVAPNTANLCRLLETLFAEVRQPVELDELVNLVAALCDIKDQPAELSGPATNLKEDWLATLVDPRPDLADTVAQRSHLARLWQEIRQMSPRHCAALLLNLRDEGGGSATELLVFTGIASFGELAATLELAEEELAALWPRLPLDDLTIAERLGLTRQQVINLRRSARERLWRRMNDLK